MISFTKASITPHVDPASNEPHKFHFGLNAECSESNVVCYMDGFHDVSDMDPKKTIVLWTAEEKDAEFEKWISANNVKDRLTARINLLNSSSTIPFTEE